MSDNRTTTATNVAAFDDETQVNINTGRWTAKEHLLFLDALRAHGQDWRRIAIELKSRNNIQVRTHAQKYFKKLERMQRRAAGLSGSSARVPGSVKAVTKATSIKARINNDDEDEDDEVDEDDDFSGSTASDSESSNGDEEHGTSSTMQRVHSAPMLSTGVSSFGHQQQQQPAVNLARALSQQSLNLQAMLRPLPPPPQAIRLPQQTSFPVPTGAFPVPSAPLYASSLAAVNWQQQAQNMMQQQHQAAVQRQSHPAFLQQRQAIMMNPNAVFSPLQSMTQLPNQLSPFLSTPSRF